MKLIKDLSKFGIRELNQAEKLLEALQKVEHSELGDNLSLQNNTSTGEVFLSNDDGQCFELNENETELVEKLEDAYGREYDEYVSLRYSGDSTEANYQKSNEIYRNAVELCDDLESSEFDKKDLREALENLELKDSKAIGFLQKIIKEHNIDADSSNALTESESESIAEAFNKFVVENGEADFKDAINSLHIELNA